MFGQREYSMVSVIIPMYNAAHTIVRCLDSVINQTFRDTTYEIIIINDGSEDNSLEIVTGYIEKHRKKENYQFVLIDQFNSGVSIARNTGLKLSKGEYISFLDSDDYWLDNKIEVQLSYFNEEVDFVSALRNVDNIGFPYNLQNGVAKITLRKLLFKIVGQTSTAIFKRKILDNTGYFDASQKYSEDANYWMRISLKNHMIILNEKLVVTDNDHGQLGLSRNYIAMEAGVQKNVLEMYTLKYINILEYYFFKYFSKFKYIIRIKLR